MPSGYVGRSPVSTALVRSGQPSFLDRVGAGFQKDVGDLGGMIGGLVSGAMAPGNAMAGNYDQVEVSPNGAVTPFDPRMVQDANNLASFATLGSAGQIPADAMGMGIKAFHGSPHSFDRFDMSKIGTGEGAQAYGHGLYFAENEGVAKGYRDKLVPSQQGLDNTAQSFGGIDPAISEYQRRLEHYQSMKGQEGISEARRSGLERIVQQKLDELQNIRDGMPINSGSMYAVDINAEPTTFLQYDKPVSAQPQAVKTAIYQKLGEMGYSPSPRGLKAFQIEHGGFGEDMGMVMQKIFGRPEEASQALRDAGVPGVRYKDAGSRDSGRGTYNYVVFDDKLVNIDKKYAVPGGGVPAVPDSKVKTALMKLST